MKMHISMRVEDLDSAIAFYSRMFKQDPSVVRDAYAKWDVDQPPVNFVVESGKRAAPGLDHLGIQVETADELSDVATRARDSGQPFSEVASAHCCFAQSDKAWVKGEAADKWELFLTHTHDLDEYGNDIETSLDDGTDCCSPSSSAVKSCCEPDETQTV